MDIWFSLSNRKIWFEIKLKASNHSNQSCTMIARLRDLGSSLRNFLKGSSLTLPLISSKLGHSLVDVLSPLNTRKQT